MKIKKIFTRKQKQEQSDQQEYEIQNGRTEASGRIQLLTRLSGSELFMDALSCLLLSIGSLLALLAPTVMDRGLLVCIMVSVVSVGIMVVVSYRWWILPCAVVAFAAIYLIYHLLLGDIANSFSFWKDFYDWLVSGAPYDKATTNTDFLAVSGIAIMFFVTLLLFVLIRKLFYFPVMFLLQVGTLIVSFVIMDTDLSVAVCFSAAGIILLLPRVYAKRIAKLGGSSAERMDVSRAKMQSVAIPAAIIAVLLALWITPKDTWEWRSHRLNNFVEDVGTLIVGPFNEKPKSSSNFSLYGMGFQSDSGRLGGPAVLSDEQYLSVWAGRPVLLKGKVMDHYNGAGWSAPSPDGDLRLQSPLWSSIKRETFELDKPVGTREAVKLYKKLTSITEVRVRHEKRFLTTLFAPENVQSVSFSNLLKNPEAYFNRRSELYLHVYLPVRGEYTITAKVWNTGMNGFDDLFVQLEQQTKDQKRYSAMVERYTQLPESLPASVRQTAEEITDGIDSPYLKACAISRWLAENAEYTLEPVMPPSGVDFTAYFLETREGYCVYFATAMTVMSRCAGLPARYVQGFALESVPNEGKYKATGRTAHAWSEVYFEGIGWLPMDPLRWNVGDPLNSNMIIEAPTEYAPPPSRGSSSQTAVTVQEEENTVSGWTALLLIPLLGVIFQYALFAGPRHKVKKWTYIAVRRRWRGTAAQLNALYGDMLVLLSLHGLNVLPGETLVAFPERVDRHIIFNDITLSEVAAALMRSHFGGIPLTDGEIKKACLYHRSLESFTLEQLGRIRYLIRRVLKIVRAPGVK